MSVSVRAAAPPDRDFVLALASRLVDGFEAPSHRTKPELIEGDRRALEAWFDNPSNDEEAMLIADLDGTPAGCAYLVTLIDYFNERPHAHLSVLAVEKSAEGRGVGSALLDACVEWARSRGSDRLTLSALVTNARARALYERKGFGGEYIRYVLPL
ncbi:MAG TPA: GNAT family N-acetyltransferase [Vicinamibacterales bacterium]|nr:GNAT family N-acetyltransferase [Vicinamibacterales bacterium]